MLQQLPPSIKGLAGLIGLGEWINRAGPLLPRTQH
jgi:hypothetical protein